MTRRTAVPAKVSVGRYLILGMAEVGSLLIVGMAFLLLVFGFVARKFAGTDPINNLLPFLVSVVGITVLLAISMIFWWWIRRRLMSLSTLAPPLLAMVLAVGVGGAASLDYFARSHEQLRTMIGGKKEANLVTLSHQIYAAYRRYSGTELLKVARRSEPFNDDIRAAAELFSMDPDLLFGLAAAESSFYPRDSNDGGVGLFQLTNIPSKVKKRVALLLKGKLPAAGSHRYDAYMAAGTLDYYCKQMSGDYFLGLLAYNIGPANGGVKFIMKQYNASDFSTIQPYLQRGPRNYPIRVLSYALAFRIWHQNGQIIAYEVGNNAQRIQKIAIPGLDSL